MSTVSLKERMKQLQALKSSVQAKSQSVVEREKELGEIAKNSPAKTNVRKLQLETISDEQTAGGETQTTAGETTASPALPPAPLTEGDEPPPPVLSQVDETPVEETDKIPAEEEEFEGKWFGFGPTRQSFLLEDSNNGLYATSFYILKKWKRRKRWR